MEAFYPFCHPPHVDMWGKVDPKSRLSALLGTRGHFWFQSSLVGVLAILVLLPFAKVHEPVALGNFPRSLAIAHDSSNMEGSHKDRLSITTRDSLGLLSSFLLLQIHRSIANCDFLIFIFHQTHPRCRYKNKTSFGPLRSSRDRKSVV